MTECSSVLIFKNTKTFLFLLGFFWILTLHFIFSAAKAEKQEAPPAGEYLQLRSLQSLYPVWTVKIVVIFSSQTHSLFFFFHR